MSLHDMRVSLCRKLGYAESPSEEVESRLTGHLNEIQHRLLAMPGMNHLRHSQVTFASVASTPQYALPPDVGAVLGMRDATNSITLYPKSWAWYQEMEADPTSTTGTPSVWVPVGQSWVSTQPSDASIVWVKSASASDVGTCYIEGIRTGGYPFTSSVTMTGITPVIVGPYTDIIGLTKFYVSSSAVGAITLHEDVGTGTELSRIAIGETHARYMRIALWPTPAAALTYTVDYERNVEDMVYDVDEPLLPRGFHWVIEAGAKMLEYEKQDDSRYNLAAREYMRGISDLKWWLTEQAGIVVSQNTPQPPSSLGAWYPAGS